MTFRMSDEISCDVCGTPASSITFDKSGEATVICESCEGLIQAGLIRPDHVGADGRMVYRHWVFEWRPGELVEQIYD